MGRKILFITTDQMRYDAIGANGGRVARTPVIDSLAADGITYDRAQPQNVVCMPSRSTMVTGQNVGTHGVWMNGVPLPIDAPSVAAVLGEAGYRTALVGKSHFEPLLDPFLRFAENQQGFTGATGGHRGFDHMELATHGAVGFTHYAGWMRAHHADLIGGFFQVLDGDLEVSGIAGGDTDAPQIKRNPIPREWYHTDWVADRTIAWLDGLEADDDWFCWMSFPDPHHPWDPPESEIHRVNWRDLDLPSGYPQNAAEREAIIDAKPRHWRLWYDGTLVGNYEAPAKWIPATLTADQIREVNAMAHIENELIDEAIGRFRPVVQRSVPRRLPHATASHLATRTLGRWRPRRDCSRQSSRRIARPRPDLLSHRGGCHPVMDGGPAPAHRRRRCRRTRFRARHDRVGQPPARRHRDAPAHDHPR
jgi:hypothetical protein